MTDLDTTFAALASEPRRAILARLRDGEARLSDLAAPFEMTQTAVSKHVGVLAEAGLVTVEKRGRTKYCRLNAPQMRQAADWLDDYRGFWQDSLQNLGLFLAGDP